MESTTRTHTGKTPMPGMASAASPGRRAHLLPKIIKRANAVTASSTQSNGGTRATQDKTSDTSATPRASAICAREWRLTGVAGVTGEVLAEVASEVVSELVTLVGVRVMVFSVGIGRLAKLRVHPPDMFSLMVP